MSSFFRCRSHVFGSYDRAWELQDAPFAGEFDALNAPSREVLGIDLTAIVD